MFQPHAILTANLGNCPLFVSPNCDVYEQGQLVSDCFQIVTWPCFQKFLFSFWSYNIVYVYFLVYYQKKNQCSTLIFLFFRYRCSSLAGTVRQIYIFASLCSLEHVLSALYDISVGCLNDIHDGDLRNRTMLRLFCGRARDKIIHGFVEKTSNAATYNGISK